MLSATASGGGTVSSPGVSITVAGTLSQVNAALTTLTDTDQTLVSDTVTIGVTDSLGNIGSGSVAVTVANGPLIAAPAALTVGIGKSASVPRVSVSETGSTATETFTVVVADINGLLATSGAGGANVTGLGTNSIAISGTLVQVNAALAGLTDVDAVAGADQLTINAADSFGNSAGAGGVAVTVNGRRR